MKSKLWMTALLASMMLLGACGNDADSESGDHGSHEEGDDEVRSLEVDLEVPETAKAGEKESFTAHVTSNEEDVRSEEHTSELQSRFDLVCRLLLEKKNERDQSSHRHRQDIDGG